MNKQEREKLRERNIPNAISKAEIIALLDHIDALEGQVQAAFYEGYGFGNFAGLHDHNASPDLKWIGSEAKAAITQAEEKGGG